MPRSTSVVKCDVKSTSLLGNLPAAAGGGGRAARFEAVMFRDGYFTEGSSSNVFVVEEWRDTRARRKTTSCCRASRTMSWSSSRTRMACHWKCATSPEQRKCATRKRSG